MSTSRSDRTDLSDKRVDIRPAHERIVRYLREAGAQPGDPLPSEAELGALLSMGRQQVREGLSVLQALGVVTGRQGARRRWCGYNPASVVAMALSLLPADVESLHGLLEVRHALEAALLPTVAARIDPETLEELRSLSARMIERADAGLPFSDLDEVFHRRLFAPLGNPVLDAVLVAFWSQFDVIRSNRTPGGAERDVGGMHMRIVDALAAGDPRLATHELDAHFFGVREFLDASAGNGSRATDHVSPKKGAK